MIKLFKEEIDFLRSLLATKRIRYFKGSIFQKIFLILFGYFFINLILNLIIIYPLSELFPVIEEAYRDEFKLDYGYFFLIVLLLPLLEELIFRLPLKLSNWRIHFPFLIIVLSTFAFHMYVGFAFLTIWVVSMNLLIIKRYYNRLMKFWIRKRVAIFWTSCFLFGVVHTTNFDPSILPWYLYFVVFFPQLIGGVFIGIVRLRFGFWYGVLLHSYFNAVVTLLSKYLDN
ncbi:CAAX protease self-immunity [Belliella buryatensis]|uniref:CAAX protease self-immunity n=1 Tax=Belliella buryatensis TaxID=1500549 RepID=A0A239ESB2_9BACT|nr:CAAX protease self-immunity [Belliella buryatensis]